MMLLLLRSQTVRVYSGDTLELQQVLSASGLIHGWFTLTYLKFYEQVMLTWESKTYCITMEHDIPVLIHIYINNQLFGHSKSQHYQLDINTLSHKSHMYFSIEQDVMCHYTKWTCGVMEDWVSSFSRCDVPWEDTRWIC